MNWAPIVLTLKLAGLTALILVAVGMPIAYWLTYSRWRWKFLAESVVALPLGLPPTVLSFYHTMGEFGVVLMVGGNIPGVTRTVSIDIYDEVQALNYAGAAETALVLLIFSFVTLSIVYALNRNVWAVWPLR